MTDNPINRIPLEDGMTLEQEVHGELNSRARITDISALLPELVQHSGNDEDIEIVLDWAMQIRREMALPWNECMECAMTFYFG